MIGAARLDPHVYEEVEGDRSATSQAMMVVVIAALAAGIGTLGAGGIVGLVFGVVFGLISWAIWALHHLHNRDHAVRYIRDGRKLGRACQDDRIRTIACGVSRLRLHSCSGPLDLLRRRPVAARRDADRGASGPRLPVLLESAGRRTGWLCHREYRSGRAGHTNRIKERGTNRGNNDREARGVGGAQG